MGLISKILVVILVQLYIYLGENMGSSIKLNVNILKQSCMRALKDFSDKVAKCREPIIQAKMKGTFGLFKLTREQAIDKL